MSVLHVVPSFYPATRWGGPIFSTKAICDGLAQTPGVDVSVYTTDAAGPGLDEKVDYSGQRVLMKEGYKVSYFRRVAMNSVSLELIVALPRAVGMADVVHVSSTYSFPVLPTLLLARLLGKPIVWSPRGAIQATVEWSEAPRQRTKRLFEYVARCVAPSQTVLHLTADDEARATSQRMPGMRTVVIPNSVTIPPEDTVFGRVWRPGGQLRVMFLSRLHQKKGLDVLIHAVSELPNWVELHIYGTGDQRYVSTLNEQIGALGIGNQVHFHGHIESERKAEAFRRADLFVLPSFSENFGIVIAEALSHGVPVVTTDKTPWTQLEAEGCGLTISPDVSHLVGAIQTLANENLSAMGAKGRAWMERDFSPAQVNEKMLALYRHLQSTNLSELQK